MVSCTGNEFYWIGETGIALGAFAAGQAPNVWTQVDAVLNLGAQEHPRYGETPSCIPVL